MKYSYTYTHLLFLFACLPLWCAGNVRGSSIDSESKVIQFQCIGKERQALLLFKHGIHFDNCGFLTSWIGHECCHWHGVHCSNRSGHVIGLHLRGDLNYDHDPSSRCLGGTLSSSLVQLKHLKYLDLSYNSFGLGGQSIPTFIGSLQSLKHLNLSYDSFGGEIPHQLANLSSLSSLDLSNNYSSLYAKSLRWLSYLTLLRDISLTSVYLGLATDWMQVISNLPFLRTLQMEFCGLSPSLPSSLVHTNSSTTLHVLNLASNKLNDNRIFQWVFSFSGLSSSLVYLNLGDNQIPGSIPSDLEIMHALSYLDLSSNSLEGPILKTISSLKQLTDLDLTGNKFRLSECNPKSLGKFCSLQTLSFSGNNLTNEISCIIHTLPPCARKSLVSLDLSRNHLWGSIPDEIGSFSSLRALYLDENQLDGTISPSLGQLSMLRRLSLPMNSLKGTISNHQFSNLSNLNYLDLSHNPELVVNISDNWVPPFQLDYIHLSFCNLGPYFPKWLLTQTQFLILDMSNAKISDTFPIPFWSALPHMQSLDMSENSMHGSIADVSTSFGNSPTIDLSSNFFEGAIPSFLTNASSLWLKDNKFSHFLCPKTKVLVADLDLSNNLLVGEIPDCLGYFDQLVNLNLDENLLSGNLPPSIGMLTQLQQLRLRNNSMSGKLRISLEKCTSLAILDLSYNSLSGQLPYWIGNHPNSSLVLLSMQSNNFSGSIPSSLCRLSKLQLLDLSINHFSGSIPNCISNLTAMARSSNRVLPPDLSIDIPVHPNSLDGPPPQYGAAWLMWKRKEWSFRSSVELVKGIDVSDNELEGPIPDGISSLTDLVFLNLSRNNLNGSITSKMGQLTSLQFLDLASNHLSGEIPSSLSNVSYLEILDLSNNNLSGRIPHGTQLQGFDPSSYMGNPGLCGEPLPKCPGDTVPNEDNLTHEDTHEDKDEDDDIFLGLCISVALGFIVGFWGVCGTLVIKRPWRHAYFLFLDDVKDRLYVRVWRRNA